MRALLKASHILASPAAVVAVAATLGIAGSVEAASLVEVRAKGGDSLPEGVVEQVKAIPHVVKLERYLYVKAEPHDVIGIEAGAPLRIVTEERKLLTAHIEAGRSFKEGAKNAAIMGKVYREDYGFKGMGMVHAHPFEVGASFSFPGSKERIRVIGTFTVDPESQAKRVFLPLSTAQRLFDKAGKLTHLFITLDKAENTPQVVETLTKALGEGAEILRR
ncbi:MAG: hypothetical protein HY726_19015 [Candidatus Rokubacteria bacterium]|nr:hypothetical protein [Candidatus Rokubacteria bacterium]